MVLDRYVFNDCAEFKSFYNVFSKYNEERYVAPDDTSTDLYFRYEFQFIIKVKDRESKRYDMDFQRPYMDLEINDLKSPDHKLFGDCVDIKRREISLPYRLGSTDSRYSIDL